MFRRARRSEPRAVVAFDRWCGDREAPALRAALEAGDTGPLAAAYARADPHRREFLIHALTSELPALPAVEAWPHAEPDSALALLVRGSQGISSAWEARGRGYAETVGESAWGVFFDRLRVADAALRRSAELHDDGVAWSQMLVSGRGLQLPVEEMKGRYARAVAATPGLAFAADQLLQTLCAKWAGSHEEMFAFARGAGAGAPDGDPRHRLVAIAHFERALEFRDDVDGRDRYRADPAARAEIAAAAERSAFLPGFGSTPQQALTLNWFALALGYFRRFDLARPLLERIGGAPTKFPWDYFTDRAGAVFLDYRGQAGLPPLGG